MSKLKIEVLLSVLYLSGSLVTCLFISNPTPPPGLHDDLTIICQRKSCDMAESQAKGLSRLALLDEFVAQTIFLLRDLMKNVDHELTKTTSALMDDLPQNCYTARGILTEVIEKQKEKLTQGGQVVDIGLSSGVDALEVQTSFPGQTFEGRQHESNNGFDSNYEGANTYEGSQIQVDNNSQEDGYDEIGTISGPWSYGQSVEQSAHHQIDTQSSGPVYGDEKYDQNGQHGGYVSSSSSHSHSFSSAGSKNSDHDGKSDLGHNHHGNFDSNYSWANKTQENYNQQSQHGYQGQENDNYNSGNRKEHTSSTNNPIGSKKHGYSDNKKGSFSLKSSESKAIDFQAGAGCKGVGEKSAFWVPGLDGWCVQNCAQGYCPKTHCVCY